MQSLGEIRVNGELIPEFQPYLYTDKGRVWIPLDTVMGFSEINIATSEREVRYEIDGAADFVRISRNDGVIVSPQGQDPLSDSLLVVDGTTFLDARLLEKHFGFRVGFRQSEGFIDLSSAAPTPRLLRLSRQRSWTRLPGTNAVATSERPNTEIPYALFSGVQADVLAAGNWDSKRSGVDNLLSVNASAEALFLTNHLFVSKASNTPTIARWRAGRMDPGGGLLGIRGLYGFEMGDISGQSLPMVGNLGLGVGVRLQAAPTRLADSFDSTTVEGDAQPGWDAEIYVGGQLRSFMRIGSDGRYRFENVAISYGRNDIRVVLYGPQGQRTPIDHSQSISAGLLPPGTAHSWFSLIQPGQSVFGGSGQRALNALDYAARVDLGVTRFLTLSLQGGQMTQEILREPGGIELNSSSLYSSGEVRMQVGAVAANVGIVQQHRGGNHASYCFLRFPLFSQSFSVGYEAADAGFQTPYTGFGGQAIKRRVRLSTGLNLGFLGGGSSLFLNAERQAARDSSLTDQFSAIYGHTLEGVPLTHDLTLARRRSGQEGTGPASGTYRVATSYDLDQLQLRGEFIAGIRNSIRPELINVQAQYRGRERDSFSAGASYSFRGAHSFFVSANREFGRLFNAGVTASRSGDATQINARISFSLGAHVAHGFNMSSMDRAAYGAIRAQSYYDDNFNGRKDPGEEAYSGLQLHMNGAPDEYRTDGKGTADVWGLDPFGLTSISVDSDKLAAEFLTTGVRRTTFYARAGRGSVLNIPVMSATTVTGKALWADLQGRRWPLSQATVIARKPDGAFFAETTSLSDGSFSLEQLYPGRWILEIRSTRLDKNLFPQSRTFSYDIKGGEESRSTEDVVFEPFKQKDPG